MSVSLSVCLFVNFSKTAEPDELKFWGMIPLGLQMVLGQKTSRFDKLFSRKLKRTKEHCTMLTTETHLFSINFLWFMINLNWRNWRPFLFIFIVVKLNIIYIRLYKRSMDFSMLLTLLYIVDGVNYRISMAQKFILG